jgi:N-formylglutamate amidohydrolase
VRDRLAIDATTIYNECDLWVDELFDFAASDLIGVASCTQPPGVLAKVSMPIARVLIDANRAPDDLDNPDGPVKTMTSYGGQIYRTPLSPELRQELLVRHWQPFHTELQQAVLNHAGRCRLLLDCHNMAQLGPVAYGDAGSPRPLICLANLGDARGEPIPGGDPVSCPPELLQAAARVAEEIFADSPLLEPMGASPPVVKLNRPFKGGYILRAMTQLARQLSREAGAGDQPTFPCIMVEVNRGLFVGRQETNTPIMPPRLEEIADLRRRLLRWTVGVLLLMSGGVV